MTHRVLATLVVGGLVEAASATVPAVDLFRATLEGPFPLPPVAASEASAITWDWDTDTLLVIGDEGEAIVRVDKRGVLLEEMTLEDFDDTEGITYLGGGLVAVVEEREQDVYLVAFEAGGSVDRPDLPFVSLGPNVGNIGLEGASLDPRTGRFVLVKEKSPQRVIEATLDFDAGTVDAGDLFIPLLGLLDLSDVQVLATVPSLAGQPDADQLLVLSQESPRLLEIDRGGSVLGFFDLSAASSQIEGVTIDAGGVIYLVDETPSLWILRPGCLADLDADGTVGPDDLVRLLSSWGGGGGDVDGDGIAGMADLLDLLAAWGDCPAG